MARTTNTLRRTRMQQASIQSQIKILVHPMTRRARIQIIGGSRLKAYLVTPRLKGRADNALVTLLARELSVRMRKASWRSRA